MSKETFSINFVMNKCISSVAHRDVWMCCDTVDSRRSDTLKASLRDYFEAQPELERGMVTQLTFTREAEADEDRLPIEVFPCVLKSIVFSLLKPRVMIKLIYLPTWQKHNSHLHSSRK